jgi:predicted oxidoreductase
MTYDLLYKHQGCIDDGGFGHDMFWTTATLRFEAPSDTEAKKTATSFIKFENAEERKEWLAKQGVD